MLQGLPKEADPMCESAENQGCHEKQDAVLDSTLFKKRVISYNHSCRKKHGGYWICHSLPVWEKLLFAMQKKAENGGLS